MNKRVVSILKVVFFVGVVAYIVWKLYAAWHQASAEIAKKHVVLSWNLAPVAIGGFCGSMITSGLVWRWLAGKMGDRSPVVPLLGAYTFSQMGKYVFGKIVLVVMRVERAGRFGMDPAVCVLSTLLENALYMISGGLLALLAITHLSGELKEQYRPLVWVGTVALLALLLTACHPRVFYGVVGRLLVGINRLLRKVKRPEVTVKGRLGSGTLALAVLGFVPCWLFGGVALWASASCIHRLEIVDCGWFAGAFALSVIIGMASFLPGGLGIREAVVIAAVTVQFSARGIGMDHDTAFVLAGVAAVLQRLFQVAAELLLGMAGGGLTLGKGRAGIGV